MTTLLHPRSGKVAPAIGTVPSAQLPEDMAALDRRGPVVITLVYRDGLGAIFDSAYLGPARRLSQYGVEPHLVTMTPVGEWFRPRLRRRWRDRLATVDAVFPGRLTRLPVPPSRMLNVWDEAKLLGRWLRRRYGPDQPVIIHAGGTQAAYLGVQARRRLPNLKVVFQCWGPTAAEFLYGRVGHEDNDASPEIARQAAVIEDRDREAFREADGIVSIGEAMTRHLTSHYRVPVHKILRVPCCVDVEQFSAPQSERDRVRQRLGLADRFVVAFVGSLHRWQEPAGVLHLFSLIRQLQPHAHLLALTPGPEQLQAQLRTHEIAERDATVLRVPHADVPAYLNASDLGLLGRGLLQRPSLVNAISSPIKYGEYLASGCPVVLGEGVGDFSDLTRNEGVGVVVPHNADDDAIRSVLRSFLTGVETSRADIYERCRRVAEEHLSASRYDAQLVQLYHRLVAQPAARGLGRFPKA